MSHYAFVNDKLIKGEEIMQLKILKGIKASITLIVVTMLVLVPMVTQAQSTVQNNAELADQIDQFLAATFPADAPGAAVLVMRDGKVILRKGYGMANLELGVPVAPEMVFRLGSVTKQFTAMAILMLLEEGKVALSDDITKYLPDYPTAGQIITIEHLLTHTAGIKDLEFLPARLAVERQDVPLADLIALFQDEPLDFAPGEEWSYSSSGYILLGAIIEAVSGMSYAEFMQQRIFTPLGMEHSYYDDTTHLIPGRVAGYARTADGYVNAAYMSMTQPYAAGALAASVDDLALWDTALYTDTLVTQSTLRQAFTPYHLNDGHSTDYGFGWIIGNYAGHPIYDHSGGINGFSAEVMRLPEDKVYIAILSNTENPPVAPGDLAFTIATMVLGEPYQDPKAVALSESALAAYEGVYLLNGQIRTVIRQQDDQLTVQTGGPENVLIPLSTSEFFIAGVPLRVRFVKNSEGEVEELQLQQRFGLWARAPKSDQPLPAAKASIVIDPAILTEYVGEYQLESGRLLTVSVEDGKLFGQAAGEAKVELLPLSESTFVLQEADVQIEFVRDEESAAMEVVLHQNGQTMSGQKVQ